MNRTNYGTWAAWALLLGLAGCPENGNTVANDDNQVDPPDNGSDSTGNDGDDENPNVDEDENPEVGENDGGVGDDDAPDAGGDDDGEPPPTGDLASECTDLSVPNMTPEAVEQLTAWRADVKESRATFDALDNPHYRYSRSIVSFTGWSCDVTFEVENGVVTKADQTTAMRDHQTGEESEETQTATTAEEVASQQWCFPPRVLGELYDQCLSETLCQNPDENRIWVTISEDTGILSNCSYWPTECADDCIFGVSFQLELL